ncbi:MAG TPA: hypothetical protein VHM28_08045 [Anaerolineales bacterium]|nr:hypothetical protein [Anaerolineales bacterium]
MNKGSVYSSFVICSFVLAACLPAAPTQPASSTPKSTANVRATAKVATETPSLQTIEASATLAPSSTFTPIFSPTSTSETATATQAITGTVAAGTTQATATLGQPISIDTLPPNTVYNTIHVQNKSGTQVDISLHCTTRRGLQTILEYNSIKNIFIKAPEGDYVYVIYVGGRRLIGSFSFINTGTLTLIVYRDRVAIH